MRHRLAWCATGLLVLVLLVGTQIPGRMRDLLERGLHAPFPLSSLAHFLLFIGMAWLLASRPIAWPVRHSGAALLCLALLTEGLQVFAVNRHPRWLDVGIDMAGFLVGTLIAVWMGGRRALPSGAGSEPAG
jgi:VanZ family protein